jgi:DNA-binding IclR family transcriptional regulator
METVEVNGATAGSSEKSKLFNFSTKKVFAILMAFGPTRRTMSLPEMAEATGISKSAAQRFSHTLEELGYLSKNADSKRYSLTPLILELGLRYVHADSLIGYAEPFLADLHQRTKESVNLWRPSGGDMVCVSRFPGAQQMMTTMRLGQRLPMFCSSVGRAYLSMQPDIIAQDLLRIQDYRPRQPNTITDPEQIWRLVQQARADGYAPAFSQSYASDLSFGAPIIDSGGNSVASINISVSATRWSEEDAMASMPALIQETAQAISANLPDVN